MKKDFEYIVIYTREDDGGLIQANADLKFNDPIIIARAIKELSKSNAMIAGVVDCLIALRQNEFSELP